MTRVTNMTTRQAIESVGEFVPQRNQRFTARLRATGREARFGPFTCLALSRTRCEAMDIHQNKRIFEYKCWQLQAPAASERR